MQSRIQITDSAGMSNLVQFEDISNIKQTATGTDFDLRNGKTISTEKDFNQVYEVTKNNSLTFTSLSNLIAQLPVVA